MLQRRITNNTNKDTSNTNKNKCYKTRITNNTNKDTSNTNKNKKPQNKNYQQQ